MSNPSFARETHEKIYESVSSPDRRTPTPEELFNLPMSFVQVLRKTAPKMHESGAWWSLGGDISENMLEVHVRPALIQVLTNAEGVEKITGALSEFNPTPVQSREWKLEREAEPDGNKYPVFVKSRYSEFTSNGVKVMILGDYQIKVGEWEWGDALYFDPVYVNLAGIQIPVMPLRLKTELYLTLGWDDRAKMISDAYLRSHAYLHQLMEGPSA